MGKPQNKLSTTTRTQLKSELPPPPSTETVCRQLAYLAQSNLRLFAAGRADAPEEEEYLSSLYAEYTASMEALTGLCLAAGLSRDALLADADKELGRGLKRVERAAKSGADVPLPLPTPHAAASAVSDAVRAQYDHFFWAEEAITIAYRPSFTEGQDASLTEGPPIYSDVQHALISHFLGTSEKEPVRDIILKSRQFGVTTVLLLYWVWKMVHQPRFVVLFITDTREHTLEKRRFLIDWIQQSAKRFGTPGIKSLAGKSIVLENDSSIICEYSGAPNPATGSKLDAIHTSEEPKWIRKDLIPQIKASLYPAVPERPGTYIVRESTAKGRDQFYRAWLENAPGKSQSFKRIFLPWYKSREYRKELETGDELSGSEEPYYDYLDIDHPLSEGEYARKYKLSPEQLLFRRWKIDLYDGDVAIFDQEYPTTAEHAFKASDRIYFPSTSLGYEQERPPLLRASVVDERGYDITIGTVASSQLKPKPVPSEHGSLRVWRLPVAGKSYWAGFDTAEGLTAVGGEVLDETMGVILDEEGEIAAVYETSLKSEEAWLEILLVLLWYNRPVLNVEVPKGDVLKIKLLDAGYSQWLDHPKPEGRPWKERIGTRVTPANREVLLSDLRTHLRAHPGWLVYDKLREQFENFIRHASGKFAARSGHHDDGVWGAAHAVHSVNLRPARSRPTPPPKQEATLGQTLMAQIGRWKGHGQKSW